MLVDRTGLGAPGITAGGLVDFALARASASFLLAAVSVVTKKERAKFDTINCWRTVVLLAAARAKLLKAVPSRSIVVAGAGVTAWALPMDLPPQTLEVGVGV
jgi:hypothetical protein